MQREKGAFLLVCILLCFLASCGRVSDKEYTAHGMKESPLGKSVEKAFAIGDFKEGPWIAKDWWESFGDDNLSRLMEKTIADSPTLGAAMQKIKVLQERAKLIRGKLLPTLDLDVNYSYEHFSKNGFFRAFVPFPAVISQTDIFFSFNYELDFWGKNRFRYESALNMAKAQAAEGALSKLLITVECARAYFHYIAAKNKKERLEKLVALRNSYLDLIKLRALSNIDDESEILSSKIRVNDAEKAYEVQVALMDLALHSLNELAVRPIDDDSGISEDFITMSEHLELPPNVSLDLIARRPDIMMHIWTVEATADAIGAARAEFYPNINLKLLGGLQSVKFDKLFSLSSWQGLVDPALNLPIFSGGRLTANLKEKVAEYEEAIYRYNEAVIRSAKEVADSITSFESLKKQIHLQEEMLIESSKKVLLEMKKSASRISSYLDVIKKEENLVILELDFIELKQKLVDEKISLIKALGGGY